MTCCLAIDIGASSGRHILGSVENGKIVLTEIYRFENGIKDENGTLVWDTERLLSEVKNGLKKCREIGKIPKTIAIDTWGVDYVLLDENKKSFFLVCLIVTKEQTAYLRPKISRFQLKDCIIEQAFRLKISTRFISFGAIRKAESLKTQGTF